MSIIPPQLQNQRFIKVDDSKRPIEKAWQQVGGANYPATDPEFMKWVETNRRYGILCGYPNNLVVIDFDDEITQREVLDEGLLPKTFSQKTARKGLLHLFYYTDDATSWKILDKDKNTLADIQGTSKQVIGPGTRIPDGREYQVVEDIPITTISSATLHKALDRFDYGKNQDALQQVSDGLTMDDFNKPQNNLNDKALQEVRSQLKIVDILRDAGISTARNPTKCPFHSSKGGKCLGFDNSKGIWNCFHCLNPLQKVQTIDGYKFAKDIVEGDIVINALGERVKVFRIQHRHVHERQMFITTVASSIPLNISEQHGMFVIKNTNCIGKYSLSDKVPANTLTTNDSLIYPIPTYSKDILSIPLERKTSRKGPPQKIFDLELSNELLWIMGLYIAEGNIHHKGRYLQFSLHHKETNFATRVKDYFNSLGLHVNVIDRITSLTKTIHISNQWIALTFDKLFGHGCNNKHILREFLDLPPERLQYLIKGIFDGDGNFGQDIITQTSEELAYNLFEAGLKLGRYPTIHIVNSRDRLQAYTINYCKDNGGHIGTFKYHNWYIMPIKSIAYSDDVEEYMVDIGVEGEHKSFLTPEGIVGNCTEKGTARDLWMKINNVTEFVDAKKKLCEKFGIKDTFVADKVAAENRERNTSNKPMVRLPQDSYTNTDFAEDLGQYFKGDESIFYKPDERNIVEITEYEDKLMRRQIIGFQAVDAKRLTGIIDDRVYTFTIKYNKDEEIEVIKSAKEQDISLLAKHHKFIGVLYKIKRFLTYPIPFLTRDAELIVPRHTPGKGYYDDRFQAYFTPETPELRIMGIDEAKSVIDDMLGEFCFKGDIDKVMAKAYIITPMCRGIYSRPTSRTPIFIIGANRERAGKDFLAGIRGILYEGQAIDDSPIVTGEKNESNNDELRKKLTSALKIGRRLYHSSNNRGYLNNAVFEQFATSEVWRDRELGKNNQLELSNEVDISLSANVGLTYTPDLHHRSRPINLFYSVENPNERIYRRSDLHGYILNNRSIILSAIYTLISSWVIAGMPSGKTPFTSFPEWARVVGGIMCYHNMGDPCINLDDVNIGGDRETQNMKEFCGFMGLHQLNDAEQPIGYTIGKLRAIVVEAQSREDIEGFSHWDLNERPDQVKFGNLIKRFVGREFHCKQQVKFMDKEGVEEWTKYKVTLRIAKDNDRSNKILYGFNTLIELNKEVPKPEVELSRAIKEETIGELSALSYDDAKDMLLSMCASNTEVSIDTIIDRGITEEQLTDFINHGIIFMSRAGFVRLL